MPYRFNPVNPKTPMDSAIAAINNNFAQLDQETVIKTFNGATGEPALIEGELPGDIGYGTLLKDPDGLARIAMYIDDEGNPILKVSKDGADAVTGTDSDMRLNSNQNTLKVVSKGTAVMPAVTSSGSFNSREVVITHGLGFVPIVLAFSAFGASQEPWMTDYGLIASDANGTAIITLVFQARFIRITATTVKFRIELSQVSHNGTFPSTASVASQNIEYYLLQETAN